ncbi:hypothetical protein CKF54_00390 [Psittacicella hinzii]|uniref:Uncharacterized protein n=1 Tax=Psittacicella hinzii TaxID=2028575 RepID=A0A3A1YBE4_9GAMM|nr:single-stranded DNA-binding protein [Psittacicella hinzii]RIY34488.1 hypothetical protein CKF54_00390 [Psittacicella hinzii]
MSTYITIKGRLGRDPETFQSDNKTYCRLSVAVTYRSFSNETNAWEDVFTEWYNVFIAQLYLVSRASLLKKGCEVIVSGNISFNKYQDKNTGEERVGKNMNCSELYFTTTNDQSLQQCVQIATSNFGNTQPQSGGFNNNQNNGFNNQPQQNGFRNQSQQGFSNQQGFKPQQANPTPVPQYQQAPQQPQQQPVQNVQTQPQFKPNGEIDTTINPVTGQPFQQSNPYQPTNQPMKQVNRPVQEYSDDSAVSVPEESIPF